MSNRAEKLQQVKEYNRTYYQKNKNRIKKYYQKNKERIKSRIRLYSAEYRLANPEKVKETIRTWCVSNQESCRKASREWYHRNTDRVRSYEQNRRASDINYRIAYNLRRRLQKLVTRKTGSAVRDLGCSIEEFHEYIEAQFQSGMTWENWGQNGWHLDHIKPLSAFDLTDREQVLEVCHYTNLQPLWAKENLRKGAKYAC